MILIDSLYINNSGGLRLLEYLVRELENRRVPFFLLADERCNNKFDSLLPNVEYMRASLIQRRSWYLANKRVFSSVLCFGNIPAPFKLHIPVYTYFHNINLLTLEETRGRKDYAKSWLKRSVFKYYKKNTDFWIVQTKNTQTELIRHLHEKEERVVILPFYELPTELKELSYKKHGDDYVYISTYVPGKGHEELLQAWSMLIQKGINRKLHLTVPRDSLFASILEDKKKEGVNVENHGIVPFYEIINLYRQSKATIYPSHNESLGLGVVEAITAGCDVVGSNLPYIHSICKPSVSFKPSSPESIAEAVVEYEKGLSHKTELLIHNQISELIDLICK